MPINVALSQDTYQIECEKTRNTSSWNGWTSDHSAWDSLILLCGTPNTLWPIFCVPQQWLDLQIPTFPWGDGCYGPESGSSKSFEAIIMIKVNKERVQREGGKRQNRKMGIKGGRGEETRGPWESRYFGIDLPMGRYEFNLQSQVHRGSMSRFC